jgi:hypothetical protein
MYENNFCPTTVEELQQKIIDTWQQITPAYTRDLISSMPRRLQMVIDSNGIYPDQVLVLNLFALIFLCKERSH